MHPRESTHDLDGLLRELHREQRARDWSDQLAMGLQDLCAELTCDVNSLRDEVRVLRREHEEQRAFIEALSSDYALSQELLQEVPAFGNELFGLWAWLQSADTITCAPYEELHVVNSGAPVQPQSMVFKEATFWNQETV
mmetsp:Transcript_45625/g.104181  ORF Transcript_45625/g.104181 Transcript_45625/m.104181 type:complete len:139 (+) Transcript_45625:92-508(+)